MNKTVGYFVLLTFSDLHNFQTLLFFVLLLTYVTCIMANIFIIILVKTHPLLHTPMYFFIGVFSLSEIIFVSVTIPKLLANLTAARSIISFVGCVTQMYLFGCLGVTECCLLAVMVYDRYLAINLPLRYSTIMTETLCCWLAVFPWLIGFTTCLFPAGFTGHLSFCGPNKIDQFFCDLAPLQSLACSDPYISIVLTNVLMIFDVIIPFLVIMLLYISIISTIIKIKSYERKQKAFSTCSSHLIVSSLFFGSAIISHLKTEGSNYDKYLAFMYTAFTPMINPFIYTFRNQDVKKVLPKNILTRNLLTNSGFVS